MNRSPQSGVVTMTSIKSDTQVAVADFGRVIEEI
jgi:hypothetical protein